MRTIKFLSVFFIANLLLQGLAVGMPVVMQDPTQILPPAQEQTQTPPPVVIMPVMGTVPVVTIASERVHCCCTINCGCPVCCHRCHIYVHNSTEGCACCTKECECTGDWGECAGSCCGICCCRSEEDCALCRCRDGNMLCCQICNDHGSCGVGCHPDPWRCSARCSWCLGCLCMPACPCTAACMDSMCHADSFNDGCCCGCCGCDPYGSDENCSCLAKDAAKDCAIAGVTPIYPLCLLAQALYSGTRVGCCPTRLPGCLQGREAECDRTCGLCLAAPQGEHCWPYEGLCTQPDIVTTAEGKKRYRICCCHALACCGVRPAVYE